MGVENIKIVLDVGKIPNEGYLILRGYSFNLYLSGVYINKQTNKTKGTLVHEREQLTLLSVWSPWARVPRLNSPGWGYSRLAFTSILYVYFMQRLEA